MKPAETLYYLPPSAWQTHETFRESAEHRAKDRGCTCKKPIFHHFVGGNYVCVVEHTSTTCLLRRDGA